MSNEPEIILPPKPMRRMSIKGLIPSLPERGKIKLGMLGEKRKTQDGQSEWQPPVRLNHFRVTTMERGQDGNFVRDEAIHERLGDKPTEIPVRLLYDEEDLNCPTRYAAYSGRTLWCSGDGEIASRLMKNGEVSQIKCPCHLSAASYSPKKGDPPKCKINGSLSVIIEGASGLGGVWKLRTTGWNSVMAILGSMEFFRSVTGGPLANIPFMLRIKPKQGTNPIDGTPVKIHYVTLEFDGDTDALRDRGHKIALDRATTHISIAEIETEARRRLALAAPINVPLPGDETEDVVEEFFSEQLENGEGDTWTGNARPTRARIRAEQEQAGDGPHPDDAQIMLLGESSIESPRAREAVPDAPRGNTAPAREETRLDPEVEPYQITDCDGEVIYESSPETAEQAFMGILNEAMKRTMKSRPFKPSETFYPMIENNDALLTRLAGEAPEIARRLTLIIGSAREQLAEAFAARLPQNPEDGPPVRPPARSGTPMPGSKPEGALPEGRSIVCQKFAYGPGRGIDWRRTTDNAIALVESLNADEFKGFRQNNAQFIAEMNLSYKDGIVRLNSALAAKDAEFHE